MNRPQIGLRMVVAASFVAGASRIEQLRRVVHLHHETLMEGEIITRPCLVGRCPSDDGRMACIAFDDFLPFGHEIRERLPNFRSIVMVGCAAESGDAP